MNISKTLMRHQIDEMINVHILRFENVFPLINYAQLRHRPVPYLQPLAQRRLTSVLVGTDPSIRQFRPSKCRGYPGENLGGAFMGVSVEFRPSKFRGHPGVILGGALMGVSIGRDALLQSHQHEGGTPSPCLSI